MVKIPIFRFDFIVLIIILYGWGVTSIIVALYQFKPDTMVPAIIRGVFILTIAVYLHLTHQSIVILYNNNNDDS